MRAASVLALILSQVLVANSQAQLKRLDSHGDPLPEGALARLGTRRFLPAGSYHRATLSPDGKTLALTGRDITEGTRVHLMDALSGRMLRTFTFPEIDVARIEFVSDGKGLLLLRSSGVTFVDLTTGNESARLNIKAETQGPIALSPDGKWLAAQFRKYDYHAPVGVWDTATGKEVCQLPGLGSSCRGLRFSDDGKRLLLWSYVPIKVEGMSIWHGSGAKVRVASIDIGARKIVGEITVGEAHEVALGPDGQTVAYEASDQKQVHVRHLPSGKERCLVPVEQSRLAFTPDGKSLLTIDKHGSARLWNAANGKKFRDLEGTIANKEGHIAGISRDGKVIATLDGGWKSDTLVVVWNADTGRRMGRPPGHEATITCLAYSPDGKLLASGSLDRTVRLWNTKTSEQVAVMPTHGQPISALAFSPDGKSLASASQEGSIHLSSIPEGKLTTRFKFAAEEINVRMLPNGKGVTTLMFSLDGKTLFAGGESSEIVAWGYRQREGKGSAENRCGRALEGVRPGRRPGPHRAR